MKDENKPEQEFITLLGQAERDVRHSMAAIGKALDDEHGDEGARAFIGGVVINTVSLVLSVMYNEGTLEERREKAKAFFCDFIDHTDPTAYDIPDDGTETD